MRRLACLMCAAVLFAVCTSAQQTSPVPAAAPEATAPAHPVTADQVHEMLQLTGYANLKKQMMANMMPYLKQAMPYIPADMLDDFQSRMEKADMESIIVKSYQAHLSTEDATQIIAFYKTPAGQNMISQIPMIMNETQQAGAQLGQKTMGEVIEAHKAEFDDAVKKYQQSSAAPQN